MTRSRRPSLCFLLMLLAAPLARADIVVLPEHAAPTGRFGPLRERFAQHPGAVDRADAFCDGRPVGDACAIPGSPFDGGGSGVCVRRIDFVDERIDAVCVPRVAPAIERGLPSGPWQADAAFCAKRSYGPDSMAMLGWQCEPPAEVVDRFCAATPAGGHCVAEGTLDGQPARFDGVCTKHVESEANQNIDVLLSRPVRTCEPAHPVSRELITYGAWRKLFQ